MCFPSLKSKSQERELYQYMTKQEKINHLLLIIFVLGMLPPHFKCPPYFFQEYLSMKLLSMSHISGHLGQYSWLQCFSADLPEKLLHQGFVHCNPSLSWQIATRQIPCIWENRWVPGGEPQIEHGCSSCFSHPPSHAKRQEGSCHQWLWKPHGPFYTTGYLRLIKVMMSNMTTPFSIAQLFLSWFP